MIQQFTAGMNACGRFWDLVKSYWRQFVPVFTHTGEKLTRHKLLSLFIKARSEEGSNRWEMEESTLYLFEDWLLAIEGRKVTGVHCRSSFKGVSSSREEVHLPCSTFLEELLLALPLLMLLALPLLMLLALPLLMLLALPLLMLLALPLLMLLALPLLMLLALPLLMLLALPLLMLLALPLLMLLALPLLMLLALPLLMLLLPLLLLQLMKKLHC
ncbi:unnamed protein product [Boreogadus saida]